MASPEKLLAMSFIALLVLNFASSLSRDNEQQMEDMLNNWSARITEQETKLADNADEENQLMRFTSNAGNWFGDVWNSVKMATSFAWLFISSPFKIGMEQSVVQTYAERVAILALKTLAAGLWAILGLNLYLIFVNKKT